MAVITLLTDFGLDDEFVGVMKGVILTVNPQACIVDITHGIAPQDRLAAASSLRSAYRYFPSGTVHVVVVDPGVGSSRAIVAVQLQEHFFVAPDNGVLTLVLEDYSVDTIVRVTNDRYFLNAVSRTFHGRDIMAPVAGHISRGVDLSCLGPETTADALVSLPFERSRYQAGESVIGRVVQIDRFGNLITNIEAEKLVRLTDVGRGDHFGIRLGRHRIPGLSDSYADVPTGSPLAIVGSKGYLEIAVNCGRADRFFEAHIGDAVRVEA
jgi:hypothetical protein